MSIRTEDTPVTETEGRPPSAITKQPSTGGTRKRRRGLRGWRLAFTALAAIVLGVAGLPAMPFGTAHAAALNLKVSDCNTYGTATGGTYPEGTLGDALAQAATNSGSTITFACVGTSPFTIRVPQINVLNTLTISSPARNVSLDGGGRNRIFFVDKSGNLTLEGVTVTHGYNETEGGGAYVSGAGKLSIKGSTFIANASVGRSYSYVPKANGGNASGGGVYNNGGALIIDNSTFAGNMAVGGNGAGLGVGGNGNGGAVYSVGTSTQTATLTITNSTFSDNIAFGGHSGLLSTTPGNGYGGAVYSVGTNSALSITSSTFTGNVAGVHGSQDIPVIDSDLWGIIGWDFGSITGYTSTGYGAGILNQGAATITNSTFTGNRTIGGRGSGGGVSNSGAPASVTIKNSIVAGNLANTSGTANCSGPITDGGYNLINTVGECGSAQDKHDVRTSDLGLGSLANNAGPGGGPAPTQTLALLGSSLAVDQIPRGTNGCGTDLTTDQRGLTRPQGEACDIGAYELDNAPPITTASVSTKPNASGTYTADVRVTLSGGNDAGGSGVKATYYKLDNGGQQTYTAPFTITSNGQHTLTYWSVDKQGNEEIAKVMAIKLDKTPYLLLYIGIGVAGVVIIGLIVALVIWRRRKPSGGGPGRGEPVEERPLAEVR